MEALQSRHHRQGLVYRGVSPLLLVRESLVNRPDLVLHIDSWRPAVGIAIKTIQCNLLPAGLFLLRDVLARDGVEDVSPLASEALEVLGDVDGREISGSIARVCLGFLLLPERVQKFDCGRVVLVSG